MPAFLEKKLKAEAASKGKTGRSAARYVYGTLNNLGAMRGSVETDKGRAMDRKHARDERAGKAEDQMAKLSTAARKSLPTSEFGLPEKRAYPMPDKSHAAKARAVHNASPSERARIDEKANRILHEGKGYQHGSGPAGHSMGTVGRLTSPHAHGHVTEGLHGGHVTPKNTAHLRGKHGY